MGGTTWDARSATKQMRKKPDSELLICQQHGQYIFRVTVLIEDETDQAHAVLMGKEAEEICGISCEDLIIKKNCKNQRIIPQEILQLEGEIKLLKLKTGTKRDFLIKGVGIRRCSQVHTNPRYRTNNFHAKSS